MLYLPVKVTKPNEMLYVRLSVSTAAATRVLLCCRVFVLMCLFVCLRVRGTLLHFGPPPPFVSIALTTVLEGRSVIQ